MREVFFRFYIRLDIQAPELDDFRKHLVDGEGTEFIKPFLRAVRDGGICMFCHDIGDVFEHLKREYIKVGRSFISVSYGFSKCIKVLIDIPVELDTVNTWNCCRCLEGHTVDIEADRDTKGKFGPPDIAQTIFSKIDDCDIFIADVSAVCQYETRNAVKENIMLSIEGTNFRCFYFW